MNVKQGRDEVPTLLAFGYKTLTILEESHIPVLVEYFENGRLGVNVIEFGRHECLNVIRQGLQ